MKFEEKLASLESVVGKLEGGDLSLEDSLAEFEKGIGLVRELTRELDQVERRLEVLARDAQGELELRLLPEKARDTAAAAAESNRSDDDEDGADD